MVGMEVIAGHAHLAYANLFLRCPQDSSSALVKALVKKPQLLFFSTKLQGLLNLDKVNIYLRVLEAVPQLLLVIQSL